MGKPNVLLVNCDDMGYGDLGCYGSRANRTPVIDRLAAEGLRFTSFYAASPVCSPSRAGLLTGCYPPRVGIHAVLFPGDAEGLNPSEYTLGQMFRDAGYRTMIVGKWHLGDQEGSLPLRFGFDEYYGLPYSNDMGVQKGKTDFVRYPPLPLLRGDEVVEEQPDQRSLTERYVEQCVSFMRGAKGRPFFLYLAHMHVHLPLYAQDRFVQASLNGDYGACVEEVDWAMEALMAQIRAQGIEQDTLVIFTSDNGSRGDHGASNAPLRGGKFTAWEGGVRVPCVMYWPGHIPAGQVNPNMAANVDLLPTLSALAGGRRPGKDIDGVDISAMLTDEAAAPRENMIYFAPYGQGSQLCAVREGKWKLHLHRDGKAVRELYDLEKDVGEAENVYGEHPDVAERLKELYRLYSRRLGDTAEGIKAEEARPCRVEAHPRTLTVYDPNHPYMVAMYDKDDAG